MMFYGKSQASGSFLAPFGLGPTESTEETRRMARLLGMMKGNRTDHRAPQIPPQTSQQLKDTTHARVHVRLEILQFYLFLCGLMSSTQSRQGHRLSWFHLSAL